MTIELSAIEFQTADEAIQHMYADGRGEAIALGDKFLVVDTQCVHRLEEAGAAFAYLCDHEMPDGSHQIVTVPVN